MSHDEADHVAERIDQCLSCFTDQWEWIDQRLQDPGWFMEPGWIMEHGGDAFDNVPLNVQMARHFVRLLGSLAKARVKGRMSSEQEARYWSALDRFASRWPLPGDPRVRPELASDMDRVREAD